MAGRVGSLYYEVLLNADGVEKGAAKIRKEERSITSFIKKQQKEVLSARQQARMEAERLAKENWRVNKHDAVKRAAISKLIVENYKRRNRAIEAEERRHQKKMKEIRQQDADNRFMAGGQARLDKLAMIGKLKSELGALGGMGGKAGIFAAIGNQIDFVAAKVAKVTMTLFPLIVAFTAIKRGWQKVIGVGLDLVKAFDEKKKSLMVLEQLYGGNKEVVAELRAELVDYAKQTAFSVKDTMDLAIQLKALGFQAGETVSAIKMFGKLSFGDPAKLKLIAKAYSDVRAQGKLLMTEVRQFANQGVPLLLKLQDQMGMSALEVRDAMKNGLIGFDDVKRALEEISQDFGDSDKMGLKTFTGQMDALTEAWGELKAELGENDFMVEVGKSANQAMDALSELVKVTKKFKIDWIASFLAPLENSGPVIGKIVKGIRLVVKNMWLLNKAMRALKMGLSFAELDALDAIMAKAAEAAQQKRDNAKLEAQLHAADMRRMEEKLAMQERENKAAETYMRERTRLMRDINGLTGPEDTIVAYKESLQQNDELSQTDIEMLTELKKQSMIAEEHRAWDELTQKRYEHLEARREKMLEQALPSKMKQNSIEEFIYLKTARDNAEKERKAEARWQQEMDAKQQQHDATIQAIDGISVNIQQNDLQTH